MGCRCFRAAAESATEPTPKKSRKSVVIDDLRDQTSKIKERVEFSLQDEAEEAQVIDFLNRSIEQAKTTTDHFVQIIDADPQAFDQLFVQQRQQAIENQSYRSTIESWHFESLPQLVDAIKTLAKNKSPVDSHWIIFYSITFNIGYDTVSYFSKTHTRQSTENVFLTKKAVCDGYVNLYKYLCDQLNLPCKIVGGYSKGYGFDACMDAPSEVDHAWNAVQVNRHWYLMDSTWGAGSLNDQKSFTRELNPYYFFPRPHQMIYHHLPENTRWQLLKEPISMKQFLQMPNLYPAYFELNLELIYPCNQSHVQLLSNKAYALVLVKAPEHVSLLADLKLQDEIVIGGHQVIYDRTRKLYCCCFAPNTIGKHKITIYAKRTAQETDLHSSAINLHMDIDDMPTNPISYPQTWQLFFDLQLKIVSPINTHLIRLGKGGDDDDAFAKILIEAPQDVELLGKLLSEKKEEIDGGQQVYYNASIRSWVCCFAPNEDGMFDAMIMAKRKSDQGLYTSAVAFKIDAKNIPEPPVSYPKTWQLFHDLQLKVLSPVNTYIIRLKNGDAFVRILIQTPDDVLLLGRLLNEKKEEIEEGQQVYYDPSEHHWICCFAPNDDGMFEATIMAKRKSDPGLYTSAVAFKIDAKDIPKPPVSYPKTWQLFHDLQLKVLSPVNTHIIRLENGDTFATVLIQAPDGVELLGRLENDEKGEVDGGHQVYYDRTQHCWQCRFAPNEDGIFKADIMAKRKSDQGLYTSAVEFQIEAKDIPTPPLSYPKTWQTFHDWNLKIDVPCNRSTAVWSDDASFTEVRMETPEDIELLCKIAYDNVEEENHTLTQFDHEKQQWQLLFAPQQTGQHQLSIFARHRSDVNEEFTIVAQLDLHVTSLRDPMTFPFTYNTFITHRCRIYEPLNGILKKHASIPFHCRIPGATDVKLQIDRKWLDTDGYKDSIFQTEAQTGSNDVTVYAKYDNHSNRYDALIKYSVQ